jgi:hypothetical protein
MSNDGMTKEFKDKDGRRDRCRVLERLSLGVWTLLRHLGLETRHSNSSHFGLSLVVSGDHGGHSWSSLVKAITNMVKAQSQAGLFCKNLFMNNLRFKTMRKAVKVILSACKVFHYTSGGGDLA